MRAIEPTVEWISEKLQVERLSQRDLADALGLDPSAVTRLLKGQRRLRADEVPLVMSFFAERGASSEGAPPRLGVAFSLPGAAVSAIAGRTGIDVQRLLELKHGRGRSATLEEAAALGEAFGMDAAGLLSTSPVAQSEKEAMRSALRHGRGEPVSRLGSSLPARRTIPVHGAPQHLGQGRYAGGMPVVEWRSPPEALADVPGAFGIYIGGDWLRPMLLRGDVAFVHPGRPARENERVLVRFDDEELGFGVLAGGEIEVAHSGGADRIRLHEAKDLRLMAIVAVAFG